MGPSRARISAAFPPVKPWGDRKREDKEKRIGGYQEKKNIPAPSRDCWSLSNTASTWLRRRRRRRREEEKKQVGGSKQREGKRR